MYFGHFSGITGDLRWLGRSSGLCGHYDNLAGQLHLGSAFEKFGNDHDPSYQFSIKGLDNRAYFMQTWQEDTFDGTQKTQVIFPLKPGGFVMWLLSLFGRERILRWFLANTEIADGRTGIPFQYENEGAKIRNARALFHATLIAYKNRFLIFNLVLCKESLLWKYVPPKKAHS